MKLTSRMLLALWTTFPFAACAAPFAFAPLPMEQPETVVKQVKPMLAHLEKSLAACRAFCTNIRQMVKMLSICSICKHLRRVCSDKRHLGPSLNRFIVPKTLFFLSPTGC